MRGHVTDSAPPTKFRLVRASERKRDNMDSQRHAQDSLEQYRLLTARETGLEFGRGSYAAVVEVDYKGLRCAGKKVHRVLYEGQVDNLRYQDGAWA